MRFWLLALGMVIFIGAAQAAEEETVNPDPLVRELLAPGGELKDHHRDPELYRAFCFYHQNNKTLEAGKEILGKAAKAHPDLREIWFGVGLAAMLTQDIKGWQAGALKALEVSPGWALALNLLGTSYLEQKRLLDARQVLLSAISAQPTLRFPYLNLYRATARTAEALTIAETARHYLDRADSKTAEEIRRALAWAANIILDDASRGNDVVGVRLALELSKMANSSGVEARSLLSAARMAIDVDEQAQGRNLLEQALEVLKGAEEEQRALGYMRAGELLVALGDVRQALDKLKLAAELGDKTGNAAIAYSAWMNRCQQLENLKETKAARKCWGKAIYYSVASGGYGSVESQLQMACPLAKRTGKHACRCVGKALEQLESFGPLGSCLSGIFLSNCRSARYGQVAVLALRQQTAKVCAGVPDVKTDYAFAASYAQLLAQLERLDEAIEMSRLSVTLCGQQRELWDSRSQHRLAGDFLRMECHGMSRTAEYIALKGEFAQSVEELERLVILLETEQERHVISGAHQMLHLAPLLSSPKHELEVVDLALRAAVASRDPVAVSEALLDKAQFLGMEGRGAEVPALYQQARKSLASAGQASSTFRGLIASCELERKTGRLNSAIHACRRAVDLVKDADPGLEQAVAWNALAGTYQDAGLEDAMLDATLKTAQAHVSSGYHEMAATQFNTVALHYLHRRESRKALELAGRALELARSKSETVRALVNEAGALLLLGKLRRARKKVSEAVNKVGDDELVWQGVMRSVSSYHDGPVHQTVYEAASKWAAVRRASSLTGPLTQALLLSMEARARGNDADCFARVKRIIEEAEAGGHTPREVLAIGWDLALRSGDMETANLYQRTICLRDGDEDCYQEEEAAQGNANNITGLMMGVQGLMTREMGKPENAALMRSKLQDKLVAGLDKKKADARADAMVESAFPDTVWALVNASVTVAMVNPARGVALARAALEEMPEQADPDKKIAVYLANGEALHFAKNDGEALEFFGKALALANRSKGKGIRQKRLFEVSRRFIVAGFCKEALPLAREAMANFSGPAHSPMYLVLSVQAMQCELGLARVQGMDALVALVPRLTRVAQRLEQATQHGMAGLFYMQGGAALVEGGNLNEGIKLLLKAAAAVERFRKTVTDVEISAQVFAGFGRFPFDAGIAALLQRGNPGDAEKALSLSEQTRAWTLLEELGRKGVQRAAARVPQALLKEERTAGVVVQKAENDLRRIQSERPWDDKTIAKVRNALETALSNMSAVEERLWAKSPGYASLRYPRPLSLSRVPLQPEELLVEYRSWGLGGVYAWVIGVDRLTGKPTVLSASHIADNPEAFEEKIDGHSQWLRSYTRILRDEHEPPSGLAAAAHALLAPILEQIDSQIHKRLLVVPDGAMRKLPLGAINLAGTKGCLTATGGKAQFLVDCLDISYLPSITTLVVQRQIPETPVPKGVFLGLGDPVFSPDDERLRTGLEKYNIAARKCLPKVRLPGSGAEVENASRKLCPANPSLCTTLTGVRATETSWRAKVAAGFAVLHFATHTGVLSSGDTCPGPLEGGESALALSVESSPLWDGVLSRTEVMELDLTSARLAVLSACSSATGESDPGQGIAGLAGAFMYAGVTEILGTLWPLADEPAAQMMEAFYQAYSKKPDAAAALARARERLRSLEATRDPFFWAPFVLYGAPAVSKQ